jgi:alanyl-tRNA synthetase
METIQARMHTAEHIFFQALQRQIPTLKLDKIDINAKESHLYVNAPSLDIDQVLEAEKLANSVIKEDVAVKEKFVPKTDEAALKELRIKIERIKEDTVRVIEISGFDKSACSGEHVASTGLIGGLLITRFNALGKNKYEIRFKVDFEDDMFEFARIARQVKDAAGTDYPMLVKFIANAKEENVKLKEKVRELSGKIEVDVTKEVIDGVTLHYAVFPGINKKQFVEKLNAIEDKDYVIVFVNEDEKKQIAVKSDCKDANSTLQGVLKSFEGKGGGNELLAQGSFEGKSEEVLKKVKELTK